MSTKDLQHVDKHVLIGEALDAMNPGSVDGVAYLNTKTGKIDIIELSPNEYDSKYTDDPWIELYRVKNDFDPELVDLVADDSELERLKMTGMSCVDFWGADETRDRMINVLADNFEFGVDIQWYKCRALELRQQYTYKSFVVAQINEDCAIAGYHHSKGKFVITNLLPDNLVPGGDKTYFDTLDDLIIGMIEFENNVLIPKYDIRWVC